MLAGRARIISCLIRKKKKSQRDNLSQLMIGEFKLVIIVIDNNINHEHYLRETFPITGFSIFQLILVSLAELYYMLCVLNAVCQGDRNGILSMKIIFIPHCFTLCILCVPQLLLKSFIIFLGTLVAENLFL